MHPSQQPPCGTSDSDSDHLLLGEGEPDFSEEAFEVPYSCNSSRAANELQCLQPGTLISILYYPSTGSLLVFPYQSQHVKGTKAGKL